MGTGRSFWAQNRHRRHGEYGGVYLGFNIRRTADVERCQAVLCERYGLENPQELHVTVGYVGRIPQDALPGLVEYMGGLKHNVLPNFTGLQVDGTSACAQMYDVVTEQFGDADFHKFSDRPRAVWWIVKRTRALDQVRERLLKALERAGIAVDCENVSEAWTPHARIGSLHYLNSALKGAVWLSGVPLPGPVIDTPSAPTRLSSLEVDRLHFTNGETQPRSLGPVWSYRSE